MNTVKCKYAFKILISPMNLKMRSLKKNFYFFKLHLLLAQCIKNMSLTNNALRLK